MAVGGGQDPRLEGNFRGAAHRFHPAFLENPQELDLHRGTDFANLIQQDRPFPGRDQDSRPVPGGAGKGALDVPKHLALQNAFRQGRAVDWEKRLTRSGALPVNGSGHQFFAGPALSNDQHRGARSGNLVDQGPNPLHRHALADEQIFLFRTERVAKLLVLLAQALLLESLLDQEHQLLVVERLADVVVGALPHCFDGGGGCAIGGNQDHLRRNRAGPRCPQHRESALLAQLDVRNNDIQIVLEDQVRRLLGVGGGDHLVAGSGEQDF